ncbi:hypothetical protein [Psychromonas aquimarina]|uniref:hypothetical protein n=1 Tax=Psychromonas aquimarina TaxID=444919 RepID=UPI0004250A49|nr:hypothetical protein [Psychromonas aquimarina]
MNKALLKLNELAVEKKAIGDAIKAQHKLICDQFCPVKIGDEIEVNGHTFKGKIIVVDEIKLLKGFSGLFFLLSGNVKKKDGDIGSKYAKSLLTIDWPVPKLFKIN